MEIFLLLVLVVVLVARWIYLSQRLRQMEEQIARLTARIYAQEQRPTQTAAQAPQVKPEPMPMMASVQPPPVQPQYVQPTPPSIVRPVSPTAPLSVRIIPQQPAAPEPVVPTPRSSEDWEATLGSNWLNKLGVLVLVIGIALLLGYSFTHMGPAGIVSISLAGSAAMLIAGVVLEKREQYRIFARGLISGGWAALYITVYSMHAVNASRVIADPITGAILLAAVSAGMIAHSLRYRSEIVTGFSYFIAFFTLAITQSTPLSLAFLVPLAASLLYLAHRLRWPRIAIGGLVATYVTCALRPDTGAPLWEAQAIFAAYWLLFEIYDMVEADTWLLPLNAVGVLGLSLIKWHRMSHSHIWVLLAAAAAVYLANALIRSRRGRWQGAITLAAGLAAAAIFQRVDQQWVASALVVEAELFYLAGLRLRTPYLRWLGTALFALEGGRLMVDVTFLPVNTWAPVAAADAVIFYANRFFCEADLFFGYGGAAAAALAVGFKAPAGDLGVCWLVAAVVPIAFGWWRSLSDIRVQGYALGLLGLIGAGFDLNRLSLASAAIFSYALALCATRLPEDRAHERFILRIAGPFAATAAIGALIWRVGDPVWLGVAWIGAAVALLELGLAGWPREIGGFGLTLTVLGLARMLVHDNPRVPGIPHAIPAIASGLVYWIAYRSNRIQENIPPAASWIASGLLAEAVWVLAPHDAMAPCWTFCAIILLVVGFRWKKVHFQIQACALALLGHAWLGVQLLHEQPTLSSTALAWCIGVIACLYAAQFVAPRSHLLRLYFSLLATTLTGALLYNEIAGRMLTIAWGIQGVALLAAGFPLRDRVLRLSGLAILLFCILKLFVYDLSYLDTLPRIFSFLVLGLILVAVSWVYTRFRDRVARYL